MIVPATGPAAGPDIDADIDIDADADADAGLDWSARTGHVVVCGLHDEGLRLVEQLHLAGVEALVVDDRPDTRLPRLLNDLGVPWLAADSARAETLALAGVAGATAIVCVESDDLRTLATALLARELRADLRIVAQLRNAAVGRALAGVGVEVLDAAVLAAPSIVDSCLQPELVTLPLGEREFTVVRTRAPREASLRELYGDLAPLSLGSGDGAQVSPGRDVVAEAGEAVVLLGPAETVRAAGLGRGDARRHEFVGARAPREAQSRPVTVLRYLVRETDRRIKVALGALLGLAVLSVTVLMLGYREPGGVRMSVVDATYFTVETMVTVGFGDFSFREQPTWLRGWAILLMLAGATLVATFFALLTNALVSTTLGRSLGGRRVTGLSEHVIVVGAGSVGVVVVERLVADGVPVVVVESDPDNRFLGQIRALGAPVVLADATLSSTWSTVRLGHARAVAILTSDDLVNIESGLALRDLLGERWDDVPVVLRVFDRRLSGTLATSFGFAHVRSPAVLVAPWLVGAALGLDVLRTLYVAGRPMLAARLAVPPGSVLDGTALGDLAARIRVVSLTRADGTGVDLPRRETRVAVGDVATLIGPYEDLLRLLRSDQSPDRVVPQTS